MDPIKAGAALHRPTPPNHISSAHRTGKDRTRVRINAVAHQKTNENKNTRKKEGEQKRQATDFKETECCPSAVIQKTSRRKNN